MRHQLTPHFILKQHRHGATAGTFPAVALFVDTSGFTPLTSALMVHGTEGAEVIAAVLDEVLGPLIDIVYDHGGFVAGFAGDAFKALFPLEHHGTPLNGDEHRLSRFDGETRAAQALYQRALAAAWAIRQHVLTHARQTTRVGEFPLAVKVCVADGEIEWGIWQADLPDAQQRAVGFVEGEALDRCLEVDPFANAGEVVMTAAVHAQLREDIAVAWVDGHAKLVEFVAPVCNRKGGDALSATIEEDDSSTKPTQLQAREGTYGPSPVTNRTDDPAVFFPQTLLEATVRGEFRRVTTLFVNLQQRPDGAAQNDFQQTLFQLLHQYGGYLCRLGRIGDKDRGGTLLLFWGAPTSHENDIPRALNFLLDLRAASPVSLRAGVSTNLVYAGFVGSARRAEYTCHGPHVNLAAREMVTATWGQILLDGETAQRAETDFAIEPLGAYDYKGFAEKQAVYVLNGRREAVGDAFYSGATVGRDTELAQLAQAIEPMYDGRFAGITVVVGEAGIGKSRLVHELQISTQMNTDEHRFLSWASELVLFEKQAPQWFLCQADEILRQPLNPFRYWLRTYFNQSFTHDEATNKQHFTQKLDELIAYYQSTSHQPPATSHQKLATEIDRTRSFLGALIDLRWADSLYEQLEPELRFQNTLDALKTLIKAECVRQPVILHVEDAHWLDTESYAFLQLLTRNVDDVPFCMLITTRPLAEERPDLDVALTELAAQLPVTILELTALPPTALEMLAQPMVGGALTPSLVELLSERTDGNPFFIEQMVLYLQEHDLLATSDDGWQMKPVADEDDPSPAESALPADVRTVLTAAPGSLAIAGKRGGADGGGARPRV